MTASDCYRFYLSNPYIRFVPKNYLRTDLGSDHGECLTINDLG